MSKPLPQPPLALAFLHLLALASLGIAQPLLDLLGNNPAFFAAHGSGRWEVVGFALVLVMLPALLLTGVELLAGLASRRARLAAHLASVALLTALETAAESSARRPRVQRPLPAPISIFPSIFAPPGIALDLGGEPDPDG